MLRRLFESTLFTSAAFTDELKARGIKVSMDGKGSWRDNVFVERLWRSIKYEEVYLHAYDSVSAARRRHRALHRVLQHTPSALVAGQDDARRVLLRDAAGD